MSFFRVIYFLVIILSSCSAYSQKLHFSFESGVGSYKMEELKAFGEASIGQMPFDVQNLADYPPYFYYQPKLSVNWEKISLGLSWTKSSTGSRYSLRDFTGEYLLDSRLVGDSYALDIQIPFNPGEKIQVIAYAEMGLLNTKWVYKASLYVDKRMMFDESEIFHSENYYAEPGLKISYDFTWAYVFINAGYCLQFGEGSFYVEEEGERYDISYSQGEISPGWNGYRLGLGISFNLTELVQM